LGLTACSSGTPADNGDNKVDAKTATSAADFGGMDALVKAAKAEGALNVIARPDNWANYGKIIAAFEKKYDITVDSANPDGSSQDEIDAAKNLKGQDTAPDVFDLGAAVRDASLDYFAPYKTEKFGDVPAENKEASGLWVNNYTGVMSIGYDSDKFQAPAKLDDLLDPKYKGAVALNGDPTQAGAAFAGVAMATIQSGGTLDDFAPGVDFFKKLNQAGNFLTVDPDPATITSGETPVVIDWSFNNVGMQADKPSWKNAQLPGTAYVSYYSEAISKDAPHPAAARLWQEFIYSDEVQNLYLQAGAFPVLMSAMDKAGTLDKAALEAAGGLPADSTTATPAQTEAANKLLATEWPKVIS
ncbi:MAG: ABC transporter substrate-binding protein, partial [Actinobacteria bacterium]|nr:ABC transporter substrate-binding protein [Actinomycetota bacterium]